MSIQAQTWVPEHTSPTWVHEHTSPNMSTWAYQLKHEYMRLKGTVRMLAYCMKSQEIGGKDITWYYTEYNYTDYMSIPAQTWVHEIVGNSKDVTILYEITGDWWQRYYMILHRIQLYWLHEHTSPNISYNMLTSLLSTWAYQPKHEYMSIPAQTLLHEHTSSNMSTWAYQPKTEYMSISAQTANMSTWAYQPKTEYMSISAQTWVHEHISP